MTNKKGLRCRRCGEKTKVLYTRDGENEKIRGRQCIKCGKVRQTVEKYK